MTKKDALITAAVTSLFGIGALVLSTQAGACAVILTGLHHAVTLVCTGLRVCLRASLRGSSCRPAPANVWSGAA